MTRSGLAVLKKDEWIKIIAPVIITWFIALVVSILIWAGVLMDSSLSIIKVLIFIFITLLGSLIILVKFFSKPDNAITFHNKVEVKQTNGKDMIRHRLFFDNNTNTDIPLESSWYQVVCGDKVIKLGGQRYNIFDETIKGSAKNQSKEFNWVDPIEEGMDDRTGYYIINWKIAYSYEGVTKLFTSSCKFNWL